MTRRWSVVALAVVVLAYLPHVVVGAWVYEDAGVVWRATSALDIRQARWPLNLISQAQWSLAPAPAVFHAVSLALHILTALFVGLFAHRLGLGAAGARLAFVAMLVPALSVEAVAYAAQQGEILGAACVILACVLALGRWWPASIVALGSGLWVQESAVAGLLLVPWTLAIFPKKSAQWLLVPCATAIGFGLWRYGGLSALVNIGEDVGVTVTWLDWWLVQSTAAARALGLLLIPIGPFTVDYDYDSVPMTVRWLAAGAWLCLPIAAVCLSRWRHRRSQVIALGLGGLFLSVLPRLIVQTPRSYLNEGQAYLMLPWFAMVMAALMRKTTP